MKPGWSTAYFGSNVLEQQPTVASVGPYWLMSVACGSFSPNFAVSSGRMVSPPTMTRVRLGHSPGVSSSRNMSSGDGTQRQNVTLAASIVCFRYSVSRWPSGLEMARLPPAHARAAGQGRDHRAVLSAVVWKQKRGRKWQRTAECRSRLVARSVLLLVWRVMAGNRPEEATCTPHATSHHHTRTPYTHPNAPAPNGMKISCTDMSNANGALVRQRSLATMLYRCTAHVTRLSRPRWPSIVPFGLPVDPLVKIMYARLSGPRSGTAGSVAGSAANCASQSRSTTSSVVPAPSAPNFSSMPALDSTTGGAASSTIISSRSSGYSGSSGT
eukprot:365112-Chlamydomonas_euryale.AAC.7